ncbi:hypothetical protein IJ090_01730 [Candidatus Saccharibacteria bacterium]|nr:hypothetical protein [Candidatus Saccharibacteria bacterium]
MVNRLILFLTLFSVAGLVVMMNLFAPMDLGPFGVLLFFTMAYMVLFGVCTLLVKIFRGITARKGKRKVDYVYAAIIALGPLMLLMVQSFGSFSLWTVGLVVLFVFLGCFMVKKVVSRP